MGPLRQLDSTAASARHPEFRHSPGTVHHINITRLWRAFVTPADRGTRDAAARKIAGCIALLKYRKPEEITERIYNLTSAEELIAENLNEDHALRLFETGRSGSKAVSSVESPSVLLANPGPLLRAWACIPQSSTEGGAR